MIKQKQLYISLVISSLLAALVLCGLKAYSEITPEDFWWLYGETDEKNATFAPAMDREITRKTRVEVVTPEKHKIFVADEYLQIRYLILVPFDVRIDEKKVPDKLAPFEITGFHFGPRKAIKNERDMEHQDLLLTLRLNSSFPYDTYTLPSFDLHYQYDTIVGNNRIPQEETVATGEIFLEKVPVYVRVSQQRNTGFLWDVFPCFLELHADNSVTFLRLDQNSDDDPLLQFSPSYPFVMREQRRSEFSSDQFRVILYEFMVAVQDFREQPFSLAYPQIAWQQEGVLPESRNIITPEPFIFFIKSITEDNTRVNPLKKYISVPPGERYLWLGLPLRILWSMVVLSLFCISILYWHHYRQKEKIDKVPLATGAEQPAYDKWPWKNLVLGFLIMNSRRKYQKKPNPKSCACLRELLARRAGTKLPAKNKLTIAQICALTADELAQLGGRKQDIDELYQLDHQLESGQYDKLRDASRGGEK